MNSLVYRELIPDVDDLGEEYDYAPNKGRVDKQTHIITPNRINMCIITRIRVKPL